MLRRGLIAVGVAAALLADVAGFLGTPTSAQAATQWLVGIDVSHWNGTINWTSVANAGVTFAIAKATDDQAYVDPTYAANRAGAIGAGIAFSEYHFARPDSTANDAVLEADHFVASAQPQAGDIVPALDLEISGGLEVTALQNWTMAWLNEVTKKLGVRPMIYTSPSFWQTYLGDTQAFADAGYKTLWIAHWGVSSPSVPANNWGGYGWTFWQWTDCWHVTGISGCVDGDRYNGLDITPVKIPKLTVSKTDKGKVSSTPTGINCGTSCDSIYDPGSQVQLTPTPNSGAVFVKWGGACTGSASCTVTMTGNKSVSASFGFVLTTSKTGTGTGTLTSSPTGISCGSTCQAPFVVGTGLTLTPTPGAYSAFTGWSGACSGSASTCTVSMSAAKSVTANFIDLRLPRVTITAPAALNGSITGSFSEIVRPVDSGNFVLTLTGNSSPLAATVGCRNASGSTVDCSSGNVVKALLKPTSPLIAGQYYSAQVDPSGASPKVADLDANPVATTTKSFRATTTQQETNPSSTYGWRTAGSASAYGGSYTLEHLAGGSATFRFTGTSITWYTLTGPAQGLAYVYVDGALRGSFNQYASTVHFGVARTFGGLASATHTLKIVVRGIKGSSAGTNTNVSIDAFKVGAVVYGTPVTSYSWRRVNASSASGGSYVESDLLGAMASFTFRGTGVDWYTMMGPDQGKAQIYLDGVLKATVDNYAPARAYSVRRSLRNLTDAVHVLRIRVLGDKRSAATGRLVVIDRWAAI